MTRVKFVVPALLSVGLICTPPAGAEKKHGTANAVTVTGCLAQGDKPNEFSMKDENGKTYGLLGSAKTNLKSHLGHKVTITGTPTKEHEGGEKHEAKTGQPQESEHLRVTNLTMVSTTCP
jgi:hypothetical protein